MTPTTIRARIVEKLRREPVEDFRIDFEDGYGNRVDCRGGWPRRVRRARGRRRSEGGTLPPFIGIRIKPLSKELHGRSLRTLDIFVTTMVGATRGKLPPNFVITIPKLMSPGHVTAVASACAGLERRLKLKKGALKLELMIETPQSIIAADGTLSPASARRRRRRARDRRALRHLRLHRALRNHRVMAAHAASRRATSPST